MPVESTFTGVATATGEGPGIGDMPRPQLILFVMPERSLEMDPFDELPEAVPKNVTEGGLSQFELMIVASEVVSLLLLLLLLLLGAG